MINAAAAQEAQQLQVQLLTPCAAHELQARHESFLGAYWQEQLCGALALGAHAEAGQLDITLLVVHPDAQRRGIARALLAATLARDQSADFVVTVAARNSSALALYKACGFVAHRHGQLGPENLPVLQLRRPASLPSSTLN